jgi:tRNA-dihydrouridine synthase B
MIPAECDKPGMKPIEIGNVRIMSSCLLAPMAGITDLPFRIINRSFGCGFAFAEMISARALVYTNTRTLRMLSADPGDRPIGVQLLGNEVKIILKALEILRGLGIDIIDFNAACPVSKVTRKGEGAGLLKEPDRLKEILKVLVKNSDVPVTVKIRAGWDETSLNAKDVALRAQDAGIKGLFIHGRTRVQGYSGRVDYRIIREVKDLLSIPVIASGDAFSPELIKKLFDETGCDGVAVARGALGNPWIFREASEYLRSGVKPGRPGLPEIISTMKRHLHLCCEFYGNYPGTLVFRKLFGWYIKGIPDSKPFKERAFSAKTEEEMLDIIDEVSI